MGLCLGAGKFLAASGALLLFASNLVALVLAGTVVFTALGYGTDPGGARAFRRPALRLAVATALVVVPLAVNSLVTYAAHVWTQRLQDAAGRWIAGTRGAEVTRAELVSTTAEVDVRAPGPVPPVEDLLRELHGRLPGGFDVVVRTTVGRELDAGRIDGG